MRVKNMETGKVMKYGEDKHHSLEISNDGRSLYFFDTATGLGSRKGDYRFVDENGQYPEQSGVECQTLFNLGGFDTQIVTESPLFVHNLKDGEVYSIKRLEYDENNKIHVFVYGMDDELTDYAWVSNVTRTYS